MREINIVLIQANIKNSINRALTHHQEQAMNNFIIFQAFLVLKAPKTIYLTIQPKVYLNPKKEVTN